MALAETHYTSANGTQLRPLAAYQRDLQCQDILADQVQARAIELLDKLYQQLLDGANGKAVSYWRILLKSKHTSIRGLYLCGGVGRGKTYMMDLFYHSLITSKVTAMRIHFHSFMQQVHQDLQQLKGQKQPVVKLAARLAKSYRVICLDEFFVSDIGDAMILSNLLTCLFRNGVTLVITSNTAPADLYRNGLQRILFLPAIAQMQQHTCLVDVNGKQDYRLRTLEHINLWHSPLDTQADQQLQQYFSKLAIEQALENTTIEILQRQIQVRYLAGDLIWFDFAQICDGPRSQNDYIEIAKIYHSVFISNIPQLDATYDSQTLRFIYLIDEFYDRGVKLVISAAASANDLYSGDNLKFEFARAQSRLHEMQSKQYLALEHQA
jgi:cell division protein ZapE